MESGSSVTGCGSMDILLNAGILCHSEKFRILLGFLACI